MADARSGHTATLLKDGRVLLAGGEGSAGAVSTLEVFDPATSAFAFAGTMSSARKDHAAALMADGRVLIAGGSERRAIPWHPRTYMTRKLVHSRRARRCLPRGPDCLQRL